MKLRNILLVVLLFLMFLVIVNLVSAGCCMETNDAEYCITGDSVGNCKEGMFFSDDCEQRTECANKGACVKDEVCYEGFSQIRCSGGTFEKDKECDDLEGYGDVCCLVSAGGSGGYDFMKENSCIALDGSVDDSVDNEQDCENMNLDPSLRKGCCVKEDGNCVYGLADDCDGFYQGEFFCSKLETQCNPVCTSHHNKARGKFDEFNIYWFDSCDNQEELAEDCDDLTEMPIQNNNAWSCGDASCKKIWDNPFTDENFNGNLKDDNIFYGRNYRLNGESWCEYQQAKVGPGLDLPGTRHYMHSCDHGKERVDVSGDGREKICIEEQVDSSTGKISKAKWLENNPEECFKCNGEDLDDADIINCCKSQVVSEYGCSIIERKDFSGVKDDKEIYVGEDLYYDYKGAKSDANEYLDLIYMDLNGNEAYRYPVSQKVIDDPSIKFNNQNSKYECPDDLCKLTIKDVPSGTYTLVVKGKGCFDYVIGEECETKSVTLGIFTFNKGNVHCVPLVPPSNSEGCENNMVPDPDVSLEFNNYYNFPYNVLGTSGDCENTEECKNKVGGFTKESASFFVADDMNAYCRSLGDCGISTSISGDIASSGFGIGNDVCVYLSRGKGCVPSQIVQDHIRDIELKKYEKLKKGKPITPISYLPLFNLIPFSFFRKKINSRNFSLFLILLSAFILVACAEGNPGSTKPTPMDISCSGWQAPAGSNNCWKCNTTVKDGGLLPDVELNTIDDKPAYTCTKELCDSLGVGCVHIESEDGPRCEKNFANEFSIPKIVFTGADYKCNTYEISECNEGNYEVGVDGSSINIKGKLNPIDPIEVNFKTVDKNSGKDLVTSCFFGDKADMSSSLSLPSPDSGKGDINHILRLVNLVPKQSYEFYILCNNAINDQGLSNSAPYPKVSFSVGESSDIGAPFIRRVEPGEAYAKFEVSVKDIILYNEGSVDHCRWDNKKVFFDDMGKTENILSDGTKDIIKENMFICSNGGSEQDNANMCEVTLQGIKEGENKFWFSCRGINGKASDPWPSDGYTVKGSQKLEIMNTRCEHSLGTNCDKIYDSKFNFAIDTAGGAKDGEAGCKWGVGNYALDVFDEPGGDLIEGPVYAKTHKENEFSHETGTILVKFRCEDVAGNTAESEVTINIEQDITPPKINKVYRYGNELRVQTNELSTCYYLTDPKISFDENTPIFSSADSLEHSAVIESNNNFYKIRCEDRFTNKKETSVYLSKL